MPPKPKALTAARRGCPCLRCFQGFAWLQDTERAFLQVDTFCRMRKIRGRRQGAFLHRQQGLHQGGRAGSRQQVADIRFHRTDHALPRFQPSLPQRLFRLENSTTSPTGVPVA